MRLWNSALNSLALFSDLSTQASPSTARRFLIPRSKSSCWGIARSRLSLSAGRNVAAPGRLALEHRCLLAQRGELRPGDADRVLRRMRRVEQAAYLVGIDGLGERPIVGQRFERQV